MTSNIKTTRLHIKKIITACIAIMLTLMQTNVYAANGHHKTSHRATNRRINKDTATTYTTKKTQKNRPSATKNINNDSSKYMIRTSLDPKYSVTRGLFHVVNDYGNFYSARNLFKIGYGIFGSAVFANTLWDEHINDFYQKHFVSKTTNNISKIIKIPGNNTTILLYLGGTLLSLALPQHNMANHAFGTWASRTLRGVIVGAPAVLLLQRVLGTKRPDDGSQWQPFRSAHAVSGHAFLGSLPFIVGAKMTRNIPLKVLLYGASTLTGLSRLNDNAHYFSQVIFGWWMGYLAASVVSKTTNKYHFIVSPTVYRDGSPGVIVAANF